MSQENINLPNKKSEWQLIEGKELGPENHITIKWVSPEGIVDCILERSNQILLSKVEIINNEVYAIPIDDRILSKIKLPKENKKYTFKPENKNIVKVEMIDSP